MKKTLLFAALSFSLLGNAQSLTQANEAIIGEMRSMYLCDSFTVTNAGTTGAGVIWDYTGLSAYPGQTRDIIVEDATTTPNAAEFPSSVKSIKVGNILTSYYTSTPTEKISQGFVFTEPTLGDVIAKFNVDPETVVTYPFSQGSSLVDAFSGTLDYDFLGPQSTPATGSVYATIDGEGTLNLPNSVSLNGVLRYKIVDTSWANVILLGNVEFIRTQYEYYAPSLAPDYLPILTFTSIIVQGVGAPNPTSELSMVLSFYEPHYLGIDDVNSNEFSVYPNPTNDVVTISGEFGNDATATLFDQSGRALSTLNVQNGSTVDLSAYENGMYFLTIDNNGAVSTQNIVKK